MSTVAVPVHFSEGTGRKAAASHQCLGPSLGPASDVIVLEGNGVSYFVTKSDPVLSCLTSVVSLFYEAGSTPTARVFVPDKTQHTSLIITLVGVLQTV